MENGLKEACTEIFESSATALFSFAKIKKIYANVLKNLE